MAAVYLSELDLMPVKRAMMNPTVTLYTNESPAQYHCPDSARTQGANERVVLCLMNELVADHERVL